LIHLSFWTFFVEVLIVREIILGLFENLILFILICNFVNFFVNFVSHCDLKSLIKQAVDALLIVHGGVDEVVRKEDFSGGGRRLTSAPMLRWVGGQGQGLSVMQWGV
jgi:hypothetical protein